MSKNIKNDKNRLLGGTKFVESTRRKYKYLPHFFTINFATTFITYVI